MKIINSILTKKYYLTTTLVLLFLNCQLCFATTDLFLETSYGDKSTYIAHIENSVVQKVVQFEAGKRPAFSFYDYYGFYNQKIKDLQDKKIIIKCKELNSSVSLSLTKEALYFIEKYGFDDIRIRITRTKNEFSADLYFCDRVWAHSVNT